MNNRIRSLDLARGFTVLFIAPIHVMLLYGKPELQQTFLGNVFRFIAEGPGAQLLMMHMGIAFYLSANKNAHSVIKKSLIVLSTGYLLNGLKFVLPFMIGILPKDLCEYLEISKDSNAEAQLFLIGDILQFAGLAMLIMLLAIKLIKRPAIYLMLAIVVCFVSPLFWNGSSNIPIANYLLHLAGGGEPFVYFPLFPWLVYPLAGMFLGWVIKKNVSIALFIIPGLLLTGFGLSVNAFLELPEESFYRTSAIGTIYHSGIVLMWLAAWDFVLKHIAANSFFDLLSFCSKHITLIYFIQWIFIAWLLPVIGYQQAGMLFTIILIVEVEINVLGLAYVITQLRR